MRKDLPEKPSISDDLIAELINLNVSKVTAVRLVKKYSHELIKDWFRAIEFTSAENKAAYLVKAIRENWQLPEDYLRAKEDILAEKEQKKLTRLQKKEQEKKQKTDWLTSGKPS